MKKNSVLENRRAKISDSSKKFIETSFYIVDKISNILEKKNISIKDFSTMIGKTEKEVNSWMTGTYDFPISIIVKIEKCLGISIIKLD